MSVSRGNAVSTCDGHFCLSCRIGVIEERGGEVGGRLKICEPDAN